MRSSQPLGSLKRKTVASLSREMWAITPKKKNLTITQKKTLPKKNLTYSSIFKVYFMKSFAAAKASLVFIKNRYRSSRSQMFFKIGIIKHFAMFTWKHLCWSPFLIKLQAFRCFPVKIAANVLFDIIFSKRRCWIYCNFTFHNCFILKPKITLICFHSLHTRCHSLYHSLSLVVPLVVTRCTTRCHFLSFVVPLTVIRCHSLPFVVTRCITRVTSCHMMYHTSVFL